VAEAAVTRRREKFRRGIVGCNHALRPRIPDAGDACGVCVALRKHSCKISPRSSNVLLWRRRVHRLWRVRHLLRRVHRLWRRVRLLLWRVRRLWRRVRRLWRRVRRLWRRVRRLWRRVRRLWRRVRRWHAWGGGVNGLFNCRAGRTQMNLRGVACLCAGQSRVAS
jgi:hypothetical protein